MTRTPSVPGVQPPGGVPTGDRLGVASASPDPSFRCGEVAGGQQAPSPQDPSEYLPLWGRAWGQRLAGLRPAIPHRYGAGFGFCRPGQEARARDRDEFKARVSLPRAGEAAVRCPGAGVRAHRCFLRLGPDQNRELPRPRREPRLEAEQPRPCAGRQECGRGSPGDPTVPGLQGAAGTLRKPRVRAQPWREAQPERGDFHALQVRIGPAPLSQRWWPGPVPHRAGGPKAAGDAGSVRSHCPASDVWRSAAETTMAHTAPLV